MPRIGQGFLELAVVGQNKQYTATSTQNGRLISLIYVSQLEYALLCNSQLECRL